MVTSHNATDDDDDCDDFYEHDEGPSWFERNVGWLIVGVIIALLATGLCLTLNSHHLSTI